MSKKNRIWEKIGFDLYYIFGISFAYLVDQRDIMICVSARIFG